MNSHGVKYIISKALKDFQYKQNMSGLETFLEFVDVIFLKYTKEFLKRVLPGNIYDDSKLLLTEKDNVCVKAMKKKELVDYVIKNWKIAKDISDNNDLKFYSFIEPIANTQTNINHLKISESTDDLNNYLNLLSSSSTEHTNEFIIDFSMFLAEKILKFL